MFDRRIARLNPWARNNLFRFLRTPNGVSPTHLAKLISEMNATPVTRIFELGSSDGLDTNRLLDSFPAATIDCFEPDKRAQALWLSNVHNSRASLHCLAIGSSSGHSQFYPSSGSPKGRESDFKDGWHYSGSIREPSVNLHRDYPWLHFGPPVSVSVITLDSWCEVTGIAGLDLIWADLQGAEVDLILGAQSILKNTRFMYTEYSERSYYGGQVGLKGLLSMIPEWRIAKLWRENVLVVNSACI